MTNLEGKLNIILNEKNKKIIPENIKKGITIFDVEGVIEAGIDTSSETPATGSDIIQGKEAFVNGEKVTGTMDLSNLLPENIKAGIIINGVEGTYTGEPVPLEQEV